MPRGKQSFFERLTGTASIDDYNDSFGDEEKLTPTQERVIENQQTESTEGERQDWMEEESSEGQLTVDVYQTPDEIVIKAIVAGVKPDVLDVSITRDMVTIRGKREEQMEVTEEDYFYKELYWGSFSRTILLPQEIEVEDSSATEKHGLLIIKLPKIDKEKQTKLKVRSN